MGFNISEVTGSTGGGLLSVSTWTFVVDLTGTTGVTVSVNGDFDSDPIGGAGGLSDDGVTYEFDFVPTPFGVLSFTDTDTGQFTFRVDKSAVFQSGSNQTVTFNVTGTDDLDPTQTDTDPVIIELIICVTLGTLVDTPSGVVAVEDLRPGDLVMTRDNGPQKVRWIGRRTISPRQLAFQPELRPISISEGALGSECPTSELRVSPQHRVLLTNWKAELLFGEQEVLVPAKALVDDNLIRPVADGEPVEYFHLLFDQHEIIKTNGAYTESFFPGAFALSQIEHAARTEILKLFPELEHGDNYGVSRRQTLKPWETFLLIEDEDDDRPKTMQ